MCLFATSYHFRARRTALWPRILLVQSHSCNAASLTSVIVAGADAKTLVSYDVQSLFKNVPLIETIDMTIESC